LTFAGCMTQAPGTTFCLSSLSSSYDTFGDDISSEANDWYSKDKFILEFLTRSNVHHTNAVSLKVLLERFKRVVAEMTSFTREQLDFRLI
jgi:hypothetical protein